MRSYGWMGMGIVWNDPVAAVNPDRHINPPGSLQQVGDKMHQIGLKPSRFAC